MELISKLLDNHEASCVAFGFLAYALFIVWRRLSARWVNWFPPLAKVVRFGLYGCALLVAFLGARVLLSADASPNTWLLVLGGGLAGPILNKIARLVRPKEKVRRGARVGEPADVNKQSRKLPKEEFNDNLTIGGVNIPRSAEPYHFFVVGSTGSGKSVAITNLIDHIESRGDIALVVDSGGEFASRYYKEGRDFILNPFDDRCAPWSPTAELAGPWDAEALAKSMIPDGVGDSKEWNNYAQTLVTSVLRRLVDRNQLSIKDLLYYVQAASIEELTPLLAGTPAAAQLVSDKTFGSIRTIAANYLSTYAYLNDNANPFSVAKFIRAEKPGFLFLTYRDDQLDSLRNMISCALDVAARTILALPANSERRVWLIIDEFASIGKVQSIEAVATKARKMGGCLLLGLQSVSQLQDRYGEKAAQTILSCLSSWLVLRCSDAETSEYVSKYIGETEISRMTRSESTSDTGGGSDSRNEQIQTQRAVLPVELQRLANLQGFFKLAGDYAICNVKLNFPKKRDKRAKNYAERDFIAKPMLDLIPAVAPAAQASAGAEGAGQAVTQDNAQAVSTPSVEAAATPEAVPTTTLRIRKSPLEEGPAALEDVLNEMAEAYENDL
ncbi:hypothetical protein WJ96_06470 [Burkholderia ubonensis]|uniref:Type IV secretion system coupling protein TraD DNA-binding domain-containing protein n=1 Tax=Burkholderia ubonensis TaxID=101571 RepID=A0AAW3MUB6_9BURK|nr:type IV secretion system DNA-binding domain-containing protein [Burkholderia ubonensis]KVP98212.1 hypothetical protein WJ96_06470 [Burkholderia ubonensis]KVZ92909.1 hypothetical protein WL25_18130 [Burkholderia ubonensis]